MSVNKLKYFFAVDTKYVMKKLMLLMFPYTHQVIIPSKLNSHTLISTLYHFTVKVIQKGIVIPLLMSYVPP